MEPEKVNISGLPQQLYEDIGELHVFSHLPGLFLITINTLLISEKSAYSFYFLSSHSPFHLILAWLPSFHLAETALIKFISYLLLTKWNVQLSVLFYPSY